MFRISLSGPNKNALGTTLMTEALARVREADGQPLLLTGEGDAFSAGLNLKEVYELDREQMRGFLALLTELVTELYQYPGPTAAAVNGHAIAGGAILALVCDHRVATVNPKALIGLNEVALGLSFPPGLLAVVMDCLPRHRHVEVLLAAGLHNSYRATELGLVDVVADDPEAAAAAWLKTVSRSSPVAYAAAKRAIRPPIDVAAANEAWMETGLSVWTSPDFKAAVGRILKK